MHFRLLGMALMSMAMLTGAACTAAPPVEPGRYEVTVRQVRSHCLGADPIYLQHESAWACPLGAFGGERSELAASAHALRCTSHPFGEPTLWDVATDGETFRIADLFTDARLTGFADSESLYARGESPVQLVDGASAVFWDVVLRGTPDGFAGEVTLEIPLNDPMAEHCFVDLDVVATPAE